MNFFADQTTNFKNTIHWLCQICLCKYSGHIEAINKKFVDVFTF